MVTRKRLRSVLTSLALYAVRSGVDRLFHGINAYTGNRGLVARQDLDHQIAELTTEVRLSRKNAIAGSVVSHCCAPTVSIRTSLMSGPAHCSTM